MIKSFYLNLAFVISCSSLIGNQTPQINKQNINTSAICPLPSSGSSDECVCCGSECCGSYDICGSSDECACCGSGFCGSYEELHDSCGSSDEDSCCGSSCIGSYEDSCCSGSEDSCSLKVQP